jgi:hypothetical protein
MCARLLMRIGATAFALPPASPFGWGADWAWGLPLIVLTVILHVVVLGAISRRSIDFASGRLQGGHSTAVFVWVVGVTTLSATCLHGIEAGIWAVAYRLLDALPDPKGSMLYSLNAITSYGHENLNLDDHWQLMGALEALNGWLLFGLTTAFLFAVIQKVWSSVKAPSNSSSLPG